jgi:hypothetical protein
MNGTEDAQALEWTSVTGRTTPNGQLSGVMISKSEQAERPIVPSSLKIGPDGALNGAAARSAQAPHSASAASRRGFGGSSRSSVPSAATGRASAGRVTQTSRSSARVIAT